MKKLFTKQNMLFLIFLIAGLVLGGLIFGNKSEKKVDTQQVDGDHQEIWTCSMHPQIRQDAPGDCPICGMELIPLDNSATNVQDKTITQMSASAISLANIQTSTIEFAKPQKEIFLQGVIEPDETKIATQSVHFGGRIEKLFISYEGQYVNRGQVIATIYSPELVTAQQEFINAINYKTSNPLLYDAAKRKLEYLKLSNNQIVKLEEEGKIQENFNILADVSGYVSNLSISTGDYVKSGDALFTIINLNKVWVVFDAYEKDLPFIKKGNNIDYKITALGDKVYSSKVTFVSPIIDPLQRTFDIRTELNNAGEDIKTGMFVQGTIDAKLDLSEDVLIVPKSAVLWTGKRSVVYVKVKNQQSPTFKLHVVELGEELGNYYIVENGLTENDEVVTNGAFSIDAAAQLAGNYSMMNLPENKHNDTKVLPMDNMPDVFMKEVNEMIQIYVDMTDFLIASSSEKVAEKAELLNQKADNIDISFMSADDKKFWRENLDIIIKQADNMVKMSNIDMQRSHYKEVSDAMIKLVKNFGHYNTTYYVQFCPMYNDNNGAFWLSDIKEIKNPYFGDLMLTCGDTKDSLQ